jgi:hypothetical protein
VEDDPVEAGSREDVGVARRERSYVFAIAAREESSIHAETLPPLRRAARAAAAHARECASTKSQRAGPVTRICPWGSSLCPPHASPYSGGRVQLSPERGPHGALIARCALVHQEDELGRYFEPAQFAPASSVRGDVLPAPASADRPRFTSDLQSPRERSCSDVSTPRALRAGGAVTEIAPASDAPCRVSDTAPPAPTGEQLAMPLGVAFHPNRQDRSSDTRLRAIRFPAQSTFRRDSEPFTTCVVGAE